MYLKLFGVVNHKKEEETEESRCITQYPEPDCVVVRDCHFEVKADFTYKVTPKFFDEFTFLGDKLLVTII